MRSMSTSPAPEFPDYCPVCRVYGLQPCVDEEGKDTADHYERSVAYINGDPNEMDGAR